MIIQALSINKLSISVCTSAFAQKQSI